LLLNVGSGGGAAAPAAAAGGAAGGAAAEETKEEEKKEEGIILARYGLRSMHSNISGREGRVRRRYGFRSIRLGDIQYGFFRVSVFLGSIRIPNRLSKRLCIRIKQCVASKLRSDKEYLASIVIKRHLIQHVASSGKTAQI
jgi:hypothetical protein